MLGGFGGGLIRLDPPGHRVAGVDVDGQVQPVIATAGPVQEGDVPRPQMPRCAGGRGGLDPRDGGARVPTPPAVTY